jgi:hypothetical protein
VRFRTQRLQRALAHRLRHEATTIRLVDDGREHAVELTLAA